MSTKDVEVSFLAYRMHMDGKEPDFSIGMQGLYHLGILAVDTPSTPSKRKGGCIISLRRQRGPLLQLPLEGHLKVEVSDKPTCDFVFFFYYLTSMLPAEALL